MDNERIINAIFDKSERIVTISLFKDSTEDFIALKMVAEDMFTPALIDALLIDAGLNIVSGSFDIINDLDITTESVEFGVGDNMTLAVATYTKEQWEANND